MFENGGTIPAGDDDQGSMSPSDIVAALLREDEETPPAGTPAGTTQAETPSSNAGTGTGNADNPPATEDSDEVQSVERILARLIAENPNDSPKVLRQLAHMDFLRGRQAAELGELRKQVSQGGQKPAEQSETPPQDTGEKRTVGELGHPLDDLGVERVPLKAFMSDAYLQGPIFDLLVQNGDLDEDADKDDPAVRRLLVGEAEARYEEWKRGYDTQRQNILAQRESEESRKLEEVKPKIRETVTTLRTSVIEQAAAIVPGLSEAVKESIGNAIQSAVAQVFAENVKQGNIREVDITPEMVANTGNAVIGHAFATGVIARIIKEAPVTPGAKSGSVMDAFGASSGTSGTGGTGGGNTPPPAQVGAKTVADLTPDDLLQAKAMKVSPEEFLEYINE